MPRYTTSQTYTDGNTQIVALQDTDLQLTLVDPSSDPPPASRVEDEELEIKLRRILDHVPVRISNTSGSSAGSGSGDFHQYRQMRRREQDRLARMDADYQKRKEEADFLARRESRLKDAEDRTAKKRAKRQKKKQRRVQKKNRLDAPSNQEEREDVNSEAEDSEGSDSEAEHPRTSEVKRNRLSSPKLT